MIIYFSDISLLAVEKAQLSYGTEQRRRTRLLITASETMFKHRQIPKGQTSIADLER
jgi:hypothetical protein